jgi:hypothetical protein
LFKGWICDQPREDPAILSRRLPEVAARLGGKTTFDGDVREVRLRSPEAELRRPTFIVSAGVDEGLIPLGPQSRQAHVLAGP